MDEELPDRKKQLARRNFRRYMQRKMQAQSKSQRHPIVKGMTPEQVEDWLEAQNLLKRTSDTGFATPSGSSKERQTLADMKAQYEDKTARLVIALLEDADGTEEILELPANERAEAIRALLASASEDDATEDEWDDDTSWSVNIGLDSQGVTLDVLDLVYAFMDAKNAYIEANKVDSPEPKSDFQEDCENFFRTPTPGNARGGPGCECPLEQASNGSCACFEIMHTGNYYPMRWRVHWLVSVEKFLEEECEVHSIDSYSDRYEERGQTPKYGNYTTSEGKFRAGYIITRFVTHTDTQRKYVIKQSIDCDGDVRCDVYHNACDGDQDLVRRIEEFADSHGPMKGGVCTVSGKFLCRDESVSEKIVLSEGQKDVVDRHIISFIDNIHTYVERGLPNSRGVLIAGPPGTGKTMLCKAIVGDTKLSTIMVSGDLVDKPGAISAVYYMARRVSPSLVIIEDLDTLGGQHRQQQQHPFLSEYLNALNGTENNEGVFTIATTNLVGELDPALSDRPGRFDVIMRMETPDRDLRGKLLDSLSDSFNIAEDASIASIARRSDGLTGAWLREVLITAELNAKQDGSDVIQDFDLERALDDVNERRAICREPTEISIPNCSDMSELYA